MDSNGRSMPSEYLCVCQSFPISSYLIMAHINLNGQYRIRKIKKSPLSTDELKAYILDQINVVSKVKLELQQSSANIIQAIVANTQTEMRKFDILSRIYRKCLVIHLKRKN